MPPRGAARGRQCLITPVVSLCPKKRALLKEYVLQLAAHNKAVNEYANYVNAGLDGDGLTTLIGRVKESKTVFTAARKRYVDHLRQHRC